VIITASPSTFFEASEDLSNQISASLENDSEARTSDIVALTEAITNSPRTDAEFEESILSARTEQIKT